MELSERKDNDVTVLEVVGRVDSVTAPDLGARLTSILSTPPRRVLIDFGRLEYISSENCGRLALCGLSAKALELFSIAGFLKLFTIAPSRAEGVAALR